MVCESADELQARLALRALWQLELVGIEDVSCDGGPCLLQKGFRVEFDKVLEGSLARRIKRLEQRLAGLGATGAVVAGDAATPAAAPGSAPAAPGTSSSAAGSWKRELAKASKKALRTAETCSRPTRKVYGATDRQNLLPDPPEPPQEIVPESETLLGSLEAVETRAKARRRQLVSLREQVEAARLVCEERQWTLAASEAQCGELDAEPAALRPLFEASMDRRRDLVAEMRLSVEAQRLDGERVQALSTQQKRYLYQSELVAKFGGLEAVRRHRAGDVFLVSQPLPLGSDIPQAWDVGTAVANPYVVDSWPFEPNVLARRAPTEGTMEPLVEESQRDVEDERMRIPHRVVGPPIPLYAEPEAASSEEGEQEDEGGQPGTARSL
mmetsp:Transcript_58305/g.156802  ORF Transcript_58305/g.156802 Transcript_58305/m.156802 type:complete len:383 (-) Transcript_58305:128-1276(-)